MSLKIKRNVVIMHKDFLQYQKFLCIITIVHKKYYHEYWRARDIGVSHTSNKHSGRTPTSHSITLSLSIMHLALRIESERLTTFSLRAPRLLHVFSNMYVCASVQMVASRAEYQRTPFLPLRVQFLLKGSISVTIC